MKNKHFKMGTIRELLMLLLMYIDAADIELVSYNIYIYQLLHIN